MNRFEDYDDFEYEDESFAEEHYILDSDMEDMVIAEDQQKLRQQEFSAFQHRTNSILLKQAITLAKSSFFWKFKSYNTKVKVITDIYYLLSDIAQ